MTPYIDLHCDTLLHAISYGYDTIHQSAQTMVDVKRLKDAGAEAQFFAVFFPPKRKPGGEKKPPEARHAPPGGFRPPEVKDEIEFFRQAHDILFRTIERYPDDIAFAGNLTELDTNHSEGRVSAFLTLEDGRAVDGKPERLEWFHSQGVRLITLTWNHPNCFGFPNSREKEIMEKGLTEFGIRAIEEMNRLGMIVDVSHLSDGGFYDVAKYSKAPFVASHSNCRTLTPHPRNLTDDMIRVLAEHGGAAGLNFAPTFVEEEDGSGKTTVERLAAHARHLLKVGGEDVPAIGTDFDGFHGETEIGEPGQMELLFEALKKQGFTERQIEKAASGNIRRVIRDTL